MKYEIGQKVETEQGLIAKVISVETWGTIKVMGKGFMMETVAEKLKPYKTPHEKLLDMGFELIQGVNLKTYRLKNVNIIRVYDDNTISCPEVNLELSRILTEYLEWLEEEK